MEAGEQVGFRPGPRVKRVLGTSGLYEMTWSPDGRATFSLGENRSSGAPSISSGSAVGITASSNKSVSRYFDFSARGPAPSNCGPLPSLRRGILLPRSGQRRSSTARHLPEDPIRNDRLDVATTLNLRLEASNNSRSPSTITVSQMNCGPIFL